MFRFAHTLACLTVLTTALPQGWCCWLVRTACCAQHQHALSHPASQNRAHPASQNRDPSRTARISATEGSLTEIANKEIPNEGIPGEESPSEESPGETEKSSLSPVAGSIRHTCCHGCGPTQEGNSDVSTPSNRFEPPNIASHLGQKVATGGATFYHNSYVPEQIRGQIVPGRPSAIGSHQSSPAGTESPGRRLPRQECCQRAPMEVIGSFKRIVTPGDSLPAHFDTLQVALAAIPRSRVDAGRYIDPIRLQVRLSRWLC